MSLSAYRQLWPRLNRHSIPSEQADIRTRIYVFYAAYYARLYHTDQRRRPARKPCNCWEATLRAPHLLRRNTHATASIQHSQKVSTYRVAVSAATIPSCYCRKRSAARCCNSIDWAQV